MSDLKSEQTEENETTTEFITAGDVARRLAVTSSFVRKLIRAGDLPAIKLGATYRIRVSDLEAFLERSST